MRVRVRLNVKSRVAKDKKQKDSRLMVLPWLALGVTVRQVEGGVRVQARVNVNEVGSLLKRGES